MNNEWEGGIMASFEILSYIFPEGVIKTRKKTIKNSQSPQRVSNPAPPTYKSEALPVEPTFLM
jgi:hypothetical protein